MGLFSFFSRKKRRATLPNQQELFADSPDKQGEGLEKFGAIRFLT